jgi:hypothetical protein
MRWARLELTLRLRELLRVVLSMRCCMRLRLRLRLLWLNGLSGGRRIRGRLTWTPRGIFQIRCLPAPTR